MKDRNKARLARKKRIRAKVFGTAKIPRLCVFRSLRDIYAEVVDDNKGITLVSVSGKKMKKEYSHTVSGAKKVGQMIAKECSGKGIKKVVFDRGGYKYHGKVKAVADGAREGGLKF